MALFGIYRIHILCENMSGLRRIRSFLEIAFDNPHKIVICHQVSFAIRIGEGEGVLVGTMNPLFKFFLAASSSLADSLYTYLVSYNLSIQSATILWSQDLDGGSVSEALFGKTSRKSEVTNRSAIPAWLILLPFSVFLRLFDWFYTYVLPIFLYLSSWWQLKSRCPNNCDIGGLEINQKMKSDRVEVIFVLDFP